MAYELASAFIQAAGTLLPTSVLAGAAIVGLVGWRKQLQGARAVERAEACLDAAHEVADLIRAARSSVISVSEDEISTPERLGEASNRMRQEALARAWASWKGFASSYRRAGYYVTMPKVDAAQEVAAVLTELSGFAQIIATYEPHENDPTTQGAEFRRQLVGYRTRFLGDKVEGPHDPENELEVRLRNAVASVEHVLLPITGSQK
ncbi:MAG: hypothetical protein ABSC06_32665 [Rhodopila sp.]|jgi:hypothetical protein